MTIEAQHPFDSGEFLRAYDDAFAKCKDFKGPGPRPDVELIVDEIRRNPDSTNQILRAVDDSWRLSVRDIPINAGFQTLQLELVILELARGETTANGFTQALSTTTYEGVQRTLS
ncbi:MAG: hypothetical protein UY05_C0006G0022 [Candidatus Peregrinibacteria bacterium GW2011_GWA2_47_7]|nr:MAG: hypothetical protein UY05_C0006G0022 [Candidatus Peregrinibacteria bacterium GW2011_GWA2_47_7]